MLTKTYAALASALLLGHALCSQPAFAGGPNILVAAEDADTDTVPRNNRIFNRVIAALVEEMNVRGYTMIDETAAGMGVTKPGRVRRQDTEVIDVARSIPRPPIDAVVIFQIYASARQSLYSDVMRPEIRIPGRVLQVRTGRSLGSFEVVGHELPPLRRGCDRECLLETIGDHARVMARDLAAALAEKLDALKRSSTMAPAADERDPADHRRPPGRRSDARNCGAISTGFALTFDGFSSPEITRIEEYITAFQCYNNARVVRGGASNTEFWYETQIEPSQLNRNLRQMLDHMGVSGQVNFAGNSIRVVKVSTR